MVPYADLANHSFQRNCTFALARDANFGVTQKFELRALQVLMELWAGVKGGGLDG